jgi:hypothetical protein
VVPRWIPFVTVIIGIAGFGAVIVGLILTIGAWRASVDMKIDELDRRMSTAEGNQKTYIPVLLGLTKDVSYLADRARREDERADRAHR